MRLLAHIHVCLSGGGCQYYIYPKQNEHTAGWFWGESAPAMRLPAILVDRSGTDDTAWGGCGCAAPPVMVGPDIAGCWLKGGQLRFNLGLLVFDLIGSYLEGHFSMAWVTNNPTRALPWLKEELLSNANRGTGSSCHARIMHQRMPVCTMFIVTLLL
jgi:hypothetical protein